MSVRELIRWGIVVALGALSGYCFFGFIGSIVDVATTNRFADSPQPFDNWFLLVIVPFTYLTMISIGVAAARISYAVHRRDDRTAWQWGSLVLGVVVFLVMGSIPVWLRMWLVPYLLPHLSNDKISKWEIDYIYIVFPLTILHFYLWFAIPYWIMLRLPNWICGDPLSRRRNGHHALENAANGGSTDDRVDLGITDETAGAVH